MQQLDPICVQMRQARKARGWSLALAEAKSGIPAVVLGSYERGDRQPALPRLREWLSLFDHELVAVGPASDSDGDVWAEWVVRYGESGLIECTSGDEALEIASHMPDSAVDTRLVRGGPWERLHV